MTSPAKLRSGFSLLELLAVVAILGIIAGLILPRVVMSSDSAKEGSCQHNRTELNIAVERYYLNTGTWAADDLSDIGADNNYFPSGIPTCPVSGNAYRINTTTHRVVGHSGPGDHSP